MRTVAIKHYTNIARVHCSFCERVSRKAVVSVETDEEECGDWDEWFICLPCARRIGKAAEVKR